MPRSCSLAVTSIFLAAVAFSAPTSQNLAGNPALWNEFGLVRTSTGTRGKLAYTVSQMKDLTGALAVWEWQRSAQGRSCQLAPFCTEDGGRTLIAADNYFLAFDATDLKQADVDGVVASLQEKKDTSLPAILTFVPREGLVPDSARYILGPASLQAFAPEFTWMKLGFDAGAEAQVAQYKLSSVSSTPGVDTGAANTVRLAVFYYPTPEMARQHSTEFKKESNAFVKRSGVLVAIVYGGATQSEADTLLSRVQYEAKIIWNDTPPPPPIKPLYELLRNILYLSFLVSALGISAGLLYGGMRVYRRRYGRLEDEEAMTTLHLGSD